MHNQDFEELTSLMQELHAKADRYTELMKENLALKSRIHKLEDYVETIEGKLRIYRDSFSLSQDRMERGYE